jgi:hypothetical protein
MSNVAVFAVGLLVTLLVSAAMSLLVWGAVLDGREDEERRSENEQADGAHPAAGSYGLVQPGTVVP